METFIGKLVEVKSWVTSYFMEPYDSYKRRKGYMEKMLKSLAEAMGVAPDGRLVPILQYMADIVSNQMGLGKTEPERETVFSVMAELLNAFMDLLTRLEEGREVEGYQELYDRIMDILEMLHYSPGLRTLRSTQRLLSTLYDLVDRAVRRNSIDEKLLTLLDEVLFVLSQNEEEGPGKALEVLKGGK